MDDAQISTKLIAIAAAFILFLATAMSAQDTAGKPPTFTASTELVLIPAVVNDKAGAHLAGLTKDDFVLKRDGKNQAIALFEEVKTSSERVKRAEGGQQSFSNFEPGSTG